MHPKIAKAHWMNQAVIAIWFVIALSYYWEARSGDGSATLNLVVLLAVALSLHISLNETRVAELERKIARLEDKRSPQEILAEPFDH